MLWCLWCNHACNLSDATMRDLLDTSMDTASGHQNGAGGVFSGSVCSCPAWGLRGLWAVFSDDPVLGTSNTLQHVGVDLVWQGSEQHSHPSRLHSSGRCPQF